MKYEFEFDLSARQLREILAMMTGSRYWQEQRPQMRSMMWKVLAMLGPMIVLSGAGAASMYASLRGIRHIGFVPWIGASVGGVILLSFMFRALIPTRRNIDKQIEAHLTKNAKTMCLPGNIGRLKITLDDDGLAYEGVGTSSFVPWAGVADVIADERYLVLNSVLHRVHPLTTEAIEAVAPREEVEAFIRERMEASGGSASLLVEHLRGRVVQCPACHEAIDSLAEAACQACGRDIALADLGASM